MDGETAIHLPAFQTSPTTPDSSQASSLSGCTVIHGLSVDEVSSAGDGMTEVPFRIVRPLPPPIAVGWEEERMGKGKR